MLLIAIIVSIMFENRKVFCRVINVDTMGDSNEGHEPIILGRVQQSSVHQT